MRNSTEITRGYQFRYMLKRFAICVGASAFLQLIVFVGAYGSAWFRMLSGVLFTLYFAYTIFDTSASFAKLDNKDYTPLSYDLKWSVMWGVMLSLISIIMIALLYANWRLGDPLSVIFNIIFYVVESPYLAFIIMSPKRVPVAITLLSIALPIIVSVVGYICGKREFIISDKIRTIMFEKTKKDI